MHFTDMSWHRRLAEVVDRRQRELSLRDVGILYRHLRGAPDRCHDRYRTIDFVSERDPLSLIWALRGFS